MYIWTMHFEESLGNCDQLSVTLLEKHNREITLHMPCALYLFSEWLILTSVRDRGHQHCGWSYVKWMLTFPSFSFSLSRTWKVLTVQFALHSVHIHFQYPIRLMKLLFSALWPGKTPIMAGVTAASATRGSGNSCLSVNYRGSQSISCSETAADSNVL